MSKPITTSPFVDLGLARRDLESYLAHCGYWGDEEARRRYGYVLSPSALVLSKTQQQDLERLAVSTHAAVRTLNNRLCDIGAQVSPSTHEDALLLRLGNVAMRGLLKPSAGVRAVPPVIKVDLVMDPDGRFHIAEVDTYNPRGLGFVTLLEESIHFELKRNAANRAFKRYPGTGGVAQVMRDLAPGKQWFLLVSEFERFYQASFAVFANALLRYGVAAKLLREQDIANGLTSVPEGAQLLAIPDTLNVYPAVRENLLSRYQAGELQTLFPPVAYVGSKAFLPYLRACEGMEEFIPASALVGKKCRSQEQLVDVTKPLVLKATVSSGMKGVYFSDLDPEKYASILASARTLRNPSWILQEQVHQKSSSVVVFDEDGERVVRDYYLRVTAYVSEQGIVDVEVTGRPDRKVHGAPDCIMVPVLL